MDGGCCWVLPVVDLVGVLSAASAMVVMYSYSVSTDSYVVNLIHFGVVSADNSSRVVEWVYIESAT